MIPFAELDAAQLKRWMIERAAAEKDDVAPTQPSCCSHVLDPDVQQLSQEVDKLCLHADLAVQSMWRRLR